jgi:amino acid transporter
VISALARSSLRPRRLLQPLGLTAIIFFTVSGGPYGLESILADVGAVPALVLILVTPLLWVIPAILMVLELNSMIPRNGGYYQWVKTALGQRWGFLEGWWSWLYTFADLAIYPVLFTQYLAFFFPDLEPVRIPLSLLIIWSGVALNLLGIVPVGRWSTILGIAVLIPFAFLFIAAMTGSHPTLTPSIPHVLTPGGIGLGLFTVMWNYLGWDNASTVAEEVDRPIRSYGVSVLAALLLIVSLYAGATLTGVVSGQDPEILRREGFPMLGHSIGGWWLGALLSLGGMASALGLFFSTLLSVSRIPKAMADDGVLPGIVAAATRGQGVPYASLVLCALVVSGMLFWKLPELIIIDVPLYGAALSLEFAALITLRVRRREADRPFRIPFDIRGIILLSCLPLLCLSAAVAALLTQHIISLGALFFAAGALLTGPLGWWIFRRGSATHAATPPPGLTN